MSRTVETEVFKFDELGESAKEAAREWYRNGALYYDWWDFVYEGAAECGKILGIDLNQKPVKLMNGETRYDPAIYFSGFSSQGDGACFEASYSYAKGCGKAIRRHAPQDTDLHRIADELIALQRRHFYRLEARTHQRGYYNHSGCMAVDVSDSETGCDVSADTEESLRDTLRSFADWIYAQLECEYSWLMSDEQVDESMRANEYEFDEDGHRA